LWVAHLFTVICFSIAFSHQWLVRHKAIREQTTRKEADDWLQKHPPHYVHSAETDAHLDGHDFKGSFYDDPDHYSPVMEEDEVKQKEKRRLFKEVDGDDEEEEDEWK
jgi:hypothetical protein